MDIDKLEAGRKLDELVATKVMGWTINTWTDETDGGYSLNKPTGEYAAKWDAPPDFAWELKSEYRWSPSYDMTAALAVLKKVCGLLGAKMLLLPSGSGSVQLVYAQTFNTPFTRIYAEGETLMVAICRATYKAATWKSGE